MTNKINGRIIYINYILQYGHINFDKIQIDAISKDFNHVDIVLHKKIASTLPYKSDKYALVLPKVLGKNTNHPLLNRLIFILTLIYIKLNISFKDYDGVVISGFDEISLGLFPLCKNMHLICHGNAGDFTNSIKRYFMKKLSCHNSFIVFNNYMLQPFHDYGIKNIHVVSHGCLPPFLTCANNKIKDIDTSGYDIVVFHPSIRPDDVFIDKLVSNEYLKKTLIQEHILLILRGNSHNNMDNGNIKYINRHLTQEQYRQMFLASDIILLAYPENFKYKVSGVSYECVSNDKRILFYKNPSLEYCKEYYNYNPEFSTIKELCEKLIYLKKDKEAKCIISLESLTPNYKKVFVNIRSKYNNCKR